MKFEDLSDISQEQISFLASLFHHPSDTRHSDGSLGDVRITINELRDILTQAYVAGTKNS
jgi:hypothetical protein